MKILVFYTPRSKSTMIGKILANKFGVNYCESPLTLSRLANKNFNEYPTLIDKINNLSSGCIKLCANDFVDIYNNCINEDYKKINFNSFDYIIFLTRESVLDAVLSFGYMDSFNRDSWHRRVGETKEIKQYSILPSRIFNLLRGYVVFDLLKQYISKNTYARICDYEYRTVEGKLVNDFNLIENELVIDLVPNGIPYKDIVLNIDEIITHVTDYKTSLSIVDKFNDPKSFFWRF